MKFTVFGATGFIGSNLVKYLTSRNHSVEVYGRDEIPLPDAELGQVIYSIGLTGDFRRKPFEAIDAHVNELSRRIRCARFDSWLYLSSTRIYGTGDHSGRECDPVSIVPSLDGVYDLSKLLGESICLASNNSKMRVARLSNVYGVGQSENTFLGSIIRDLKETGSVLIGESPESAKDYISISDVVRLVEKVALYGGSRIYNLASGVTVTHGQVAERLREITHQPVEFKKDSPTRIFPDIDVGKVNNEFGYQARSLIDDLANLM